MANNVFANGREISCKKADGKSICAFPDVCFTPPENPATPPGIPIPYPNTGMAKDTTNGSKKVKISKKEVMLKNKSYYKKSMGDEAGCAAKKGIISSSNRGKVYFKMWSMNVKFEQQNVVRHLDIATHNHMSEGGTEAIPWPNLDTMTAQLSGDDECDHEWVIEEPKGSYTADQKKERLRKTGNTGDKFEADAADHNKIESGDDMSGANEASKIYAKCEKCKKKKEIDHVTRDDDGNIDAIVECKSGNAGVKGKQAATMISIGAKLKITPKYKLESGAGADKAEQFLKDKGWPASSIIKV